ncbi:uncharacterized protein MELLADRAFT_61958 [Melampsora larici-populina 98AG31]|uniref:Uncharacterized protein n=1 Tax=Melampsora larici-populina (strain 98AG31 / pathotype 3-4-7) TaxID=747676 RepID=F4RHF0_MELLP|nr:uncharacterized protein MELLADRAFT_61958 [Melampsora larici-populina 98AG31]EGG08157.1 hypothetical protein MELLADRAFT_61958 [Melampsora larici-populina 98AG31]
MASQDTNRQSTSSFRKESPPEDLDKDWASLFGSEGESDAAQPVRPPKKESGKKPKNIGTTTRLDAVVIGESDDSEKEEEYEVKAIKAHRIKVRTCQSSSKRMRDGDEDQESDLNSKQRPTLKRKRNEHLTKHSIPHARNNLRTGNKNDLSDGAEDDESIPQQEWHARYRKFASWDHLIKSVRTVQRDVGNCESGSKTTGGKNFSDTLYVCLLWYVISSLITTLMTLHLSLGEHEDRQSGNNDEIIFQIKIQNES